MPELDGRFGLSEKYQVAAINFEAGDHAMPQNPREIDFALRAAKVAWEKYSYLEHRYGERGRRFTDSDSCWLFTLASAPKEIVVTRALEWLRMVLASRGIPTVILEFHLMAILLAIDSEFPEQPIKKTQFDRFLADRKAERGGSLALRANRMWLTHSISGFEPALVSRSSWPQN